MTENDVPAERFTQSDDRTPWMAHRPGEEPDSLRTDFTAVALAIAVLLVIFALSSWLP